MTRRTGGVNRRVLAVGGTIHRPRGEPVSTVIAPDQRTAVTKSLAAHRRVAAYTLPAALDARLQDLSERKESLTADERAWADESLGVPKRRRRRPAA